MSERTPKLLLEDILESARKIIEYTQDLTYDEFITDSKTIDAVVRNYEIIGEASNRLPEQIKDKINTVDWYRVRGFRNRIAHEYFGLDYQIIWQLKEAYLKTLISEIQLVLDKY
ncbi:MAG: DUF86 domain-containing protein [Bacteroidetes bacterium]|nr:DUF86 domain-containing protein [Bacteroidota bacterium]